MFCKSFEDKLLLLHFIYREMNKSAERSLRATKNNIKHQVYANVVNLFDIIAKIPENPTHYGITCIEEPKIFKIANKEIDKYYAEDIHSVDERELVKLIVSLCIETFLNERRLVEWLNILADFKSEKLVLVDSHD